MKKLFGIAWLLLFAVIIVSMASKPALASTIGFSVACPADQKAVSSDFGIAKVVSCDGGGSITVPLNATDPNQFKLSITCPDNVGVTENETGGSPNRVTFKCNDGTSTPTLDIVNSLQPGAAFQGDCNNGGVTVGVSIKGSDTCVGSANDNPIYAYLRGIILFLSGIFGLLAVLMIIVSGIQYITSSGSPQAIEGAKKRLGNAILGIILFMLMFAILNYLIPGGVFG